MAARTKQKQAQLVHFPTMYGVTNAVHVTPRGVRPTSFSYPYEQPLFLVYLDYDDVPLLHVLTDAVRVQHEYDLGDAAIFTTQKGHYWTVFFNPLWRANVLDIMATTKSDLYHFTMFKKHGSTVLRLTEKDWQPSNGIRLAKIIKGNRTKRTYSQTHYDLFDKLVNGKLRQMGFNPGQTGFDANLEFVKQQATRKVE